MDMGPKLENIKTRFGGIFGGTTTVAEK